MKVIPADPVAEAEKLLLDKGVRFTPQRRLVYDIVTQSAKPLTAYTILALMAETVPDPKPPIVYRALDFLILHGLVHKIESLNAFVGCHAGHSHHGSQFIVCDGCGTVQEVHLCAVPKTLKDKADTLGFHMSHWSAELHGRCRDCPPQS